jgi:hypothetical protein
VSNLTSTNRIRRRDHVAASIHGDGAIILDLDRGCMLAANQVGAAIWQLLEEQRSEQDIVAAIQERYGIPSAQAAADVGEFIESLREHHLLS